MMATALVVVGYVGLPLPLLVLVGVAGLLAVFCHDLFDHEVVMNGSGMLRYLVVLVGFPVLYWLVGLLNLPVPAWFLMWLEAYVVLAVVHYLLHLDAPSPQTAPVR
jgi:hypothetical protein